jgi:hypothetical protein
MKKTLIFVSLKFSSVHLTLMRAYESSILNESLVNKVVWILADEYEPLLTYKERCSVIFTGTGQSYKKMIISLYRQFKLIKTIPKKVLDLVDDSEIYVHIQNTHYYNSLLIEKLKLIQNKIKVSLYVHEPTNFSQKINKKDGFFQSIAVSFFQKNEIKKADICYMAHKNALKSFYESYHFSVVGNKGRVLPLLFEDKFYEVDNSSIKSQVKTILILGRVDNTRCLDVFLDCAEFSSNNGKKYNFKILSNKKIIIDGKFKGLSNLEIVSESYYSNQMMFDELKKCDYVFNLFRVDYTQSGVTPYALMFGKPVIAHCYEQDVDLESFGCIYYKTIPSGEVLLIDIEKNNTLSGSIRDYYHRKYNPIYTKISYILE